MLRTAALCLFLPLTLWSTERAPWYPRYLELQPQATYCFQTYHTVDTVHGFVERPSDNHFLHLSIGGAYTPYKPYSLELETLFAATRHRSFGCADVRLTGRYQFFDDTSEDPVAMTVGLTVAQVFHQARHDLTCFYHGGLEGELHVAVGKETSCWQFWESRLWGVVGFGVADQGSPWVRGNIAWDHNWWDFHHLEVGIETLWGLGGEGLHLREHFRGYGPIHHQSVDLGARYFYAMECGGTVSVGYARRMYALNCPRAVNEMWVSMLYPFGL